MIYYMKNEILWRGPFAMEHRGIISNVECRDCGGTGKYNKHWCGETFGHCWACDSTGRAKLHFVETKLEARFTWHTPRERFPRVWEGGYKLEFEWLPNRPGKDLETHEAAALLNLIEPYFSKPYDDFSRYGGTFNDFNYHLYLGETDRAVCSLCGWGPAMASGFHVCREMVEWRDTACEECNHKFKGSSIFNQFAVPQHLLNPEIEKWMARHSDNPKSAIQNPKSL